ncbi:glycosyltransferase family 4 protein [Halorubrum sp. AJ67]|uniref:glycosyltransferase family 4 protein n=1 Tax=Halorubrum sp. AJ67 TaxID=1173487 RepID=UPI0003DDC087|nr:glycosyltransferase family 4 protein [Halorubrum sp. AJ67]CDK40702.1 glycosyl transferases group 1 family protein [Halorubrum sp. AJ67]
MRVIALTDYLSNVGGAELSAREIVTGLAQRDDTKVTLVGGDLSDAEKLSFPGVDVSRVRIPDYVENLPDLVADSIAARRLAQAAEEHIEDADVVHAHHRRSTMAIRQLDTETPKVATIRDFWPICPISIYSVDGRQCRGCDDDLGNCVRHQGWDSPLSPVVKRYLLLKRHYNSGIIGTIDCNVFIADHIRETVRRSSQVASRTDVVYNPIDVDFSGPAASSEIPRFVTASSLLPQKGIGTAVRAMGLLDIDAELVVFGDGEERDQLKQLAKDIAPKKVEFRGRVEPEEVYRTIAGATATVFPSTWEEPFGRVTVESMALGTPIVGSAVGGIEEVIDDGETGLLFPPGDETALSEQLRRLCANPEFTASLGEAASTVSEEFSPQAVANKYYAIFEELA